MRYFVRVNGSELEVVLDATGVHVDGQEVPARLAPIEASAVQMVMVGDDVHRVVAQRGATRGSYTFSLDGYRFEVDAIDERTRAIRALSGAAATAAGPAPLLAPMPGLIVRVHAEVGDRVDVGQGLVVMEAMKMENELRVQSAGRVKRVLVAPGTAVEKGALLVELE